MQQECNDFHGTVVNVSLPIILQLIHLLGYFIFPSAAQNSFLNPPALCLILWPAPSPKSPWLLGRGRGRCMVRRRGRIRPDDQAEDFSE